MTHPTLPHKTLPAGIHPHRTLQRMLGVAMLSLTLTLLLLTAPVLAKYNNFSEINEQKSPTHKNTTYAISGYDTVAYFTKKKPLEGKTAFQTNWKGSTWLFANKDHLNQFTAQPERYAPQYGGYCAWAIPVKEKLYSIDPSAWTVVDDKLYLNFNSKIKKKWDKNQTEFIDKGDKVWSQLLKDNAT